MSNLSQKQEESLAEWLERCPVQQDDPEIEGYEEEDCLVPGPVLKACSGSDIHLQKAASNKKGKYLAILPGILSWNPPTSITGPNVSSTQQQEQQQGNDQKIVSQEQESTAQPKPEEDEGGDSAAVVDQEKLPGKTNAELSNVSLGTIHEIDSERPFLSMPIPGGKVLQMHGRKVQTTTKFLVLSLQPKKGKVICKHIFDSALVFGDVSLVAQSPQESAAAKAALGKGETELDDNDNSSKEEEEERQIYHYGASLRASNKNATGIVKKNATPFKNDNENKSSSRRLPNMEKAEVSSAEDDNESEDDKDDNSPAEAEQDNVDSDDAEEYHIKTPLNVPQKRNSRRQSRKAVKYTEDEKEEVVDSEESSNDDNGDGGGDDDDDDDKQKEEPAEEKEDQDSIAGSSAEEKSGKESGQEQQQEMDEENNSDGVIVISPKRSKQDKKAAAHFSLSDSSRDERSAEEEEAEDDAHSSDHSEKKKTTKRPAGPGRRSTSLQSAQRRGNRKVTNSSRSKRQKQQDTDVGSDVGSDDEIANTFGKSRKRQTVEKKDTRRQKRSRPIAGTQKFAISLLSSDESEPEASANDSKPQDFGVDKKIETVKSASNRPRRQSRTPVKYYKDDDEEGEEDESSVESDHSKVKNKTKKDTVPSVKKSSLQRKRSETTATKKDGDDEKFAESSEDEPDSDQEDNPNTVSSKRKQSSEIQSRPRKRRSTSGVSTPESKPKNGTKKQPKNGRSVESPENGKADEVNAKEDSNKDPTLPSTTTSKSSPLTPSRRRRASSSQKDPEVPSTTTSKSSPLTPSRRRRASSQRKSPAAKKTVIDLATDEDFMFLG